MIARQSDKETNTRESPKGRFGFSRKALFTIPETGGPFDLDVVTLPPGKKNFPHHSHAALWEMYYIVSGTATIRMDDEHHTAKTGDAIMCPPGMAHQISNDTDEDVVYLVVSDDPPFDACYYPDSDKQLIARKVWKGQPDEDRVFWTRTDQTYYDGEERS